MTEELFHNISRSDIFTYHLVDGSYIVAEEFDYDEKNNILFTTSPARLIQRQEGYALTDWSIVDDDEITQLMGDKIITRSEAPFNLKATYSKYMLASKLRHHLDEDELEKVLNNSYDDVDSYDSIEDTEEHHRRFDWRPEYDMPDDLSNN